MPRRMELSLAVTFPGADKAENQTKPTSLCRKTLGIYHSLALHCIFPKSAPYSQLTAVTLLGQKAKK